MISSPLLLTTLLAFQAAPPSEDKKPLDDYLQKAIASKEIPGASILVKIRGKIVLRKGFGFSNLETQTPIKPESIHELASVSKQFTAAATMLMVEDGKLKLSSSIAEYIEDAPEAWKKITVEHLLHHTSGLPDYLFGVNVFTENVRPFTLVNRLKTRKLLFEPGTKWEYSNSGYMMLGYLIDKVSGTSFADVVRTRIFAPAGMKTAVVTNPSEVLLNRASGYQRKGKMVVNEEYCSPGYSSLGDGMVSASVDDLLAWQGAMRDGKVLKPESWKFMFTPSKQSIAAEGPYGAGLGIIKTGSKPILAHSGGWIGTATYLGMNLENDSCVIVLVNTDDANVGKIAQLAQAQYGKKP